MSEVKSGLPLAFILCALSITTQSQGTASRLDRYYFDITRPDCCRLSEKDWERIATRLRARRIPTFFGVYDVLNYRERWRPVKLRRAQPSAGWLILGPFDSETTATSALYRLPGLLPNRAAGTDETRDGVQSGRLMTRRLCRSVCTR
jgi:hypothetical protein